MTLATDRARSSRVATVVASSRPLSWVNTAFPFGAAYLLFDTGLPAQVGQVEQGDRTDRAAGPPHRRRRWR